MPTLRPFAWGTGAVPHSSICSIPIAVRRSPADAAASCLASAGDSSRDSAAAIPVRQLAVAAAVTGLRCRRRTWLDSKAVIRSCMLAASSVRRPEPDTCRAPRGALSPASGDGATMPKLDTGFGPSMRGLVRADLVQAVPAARRAVGVLCPPRACGLGGHNNHWHADRAGQVACKGSTGCHQHPANSLKLSLNITPAHVGMPTHADTNYTHGALLLAGAGCRRRMRSADPPPPAASAAVPAPGCLPCGGQLPRC